jgi:hypothetical protein
MGHERVGFLPKTRRWNDLVKQMGEMYPSEVPTATIAAQTLKIVRKRYEILSKDDAVKEVFTFLIAFSRACRFQDVQTQLRNSGIKLPEQPTLLSVVKALREYVPIYEASSEYGQLAIAAAADAIGQWHKLHVTSQLPLFKPSADFFESWRNVGNGAGFCELARLYFGRLTERYLNYFLDRVSSATFSSIQQREQFQQESRAHLDDISKHAFETAKITQSFAAGWFNKNVGETVPDSKEIEGFLAVAFGKLREELRREEEAK